MTEYFNQTWSKDRRRDLRKQMTATETILWSYLRNRGLAGAKFRRQFGIGPYIADFFCPEKNLAVEVDGDSHYVNEEVREYDIERDAYFIGFGITVFRVTNDRVYHDLERVLCEIAALLGTSISPPCEGGVCGGL